MLRTERLILRPPLPEDLPDWMAFYKSPRAIYIGGGPDAGDGQAWRSFATVLGHWPLQGCGMFAITIAGDARAIGLAGPWFPAGWPEKELGWSIWNAADEGRGFAHEAVIAARDYAFGVLKWPTAVSYIDPENARSQALARRLGCVLDEQAETPDGLSAVVYRHTQASPSLRDAARPPR